MVTITVRTRNNDQLVLFHVVCAINSCSLILCYPEIVRCVVLEPTFYFGRKADAVNVSCGLLNAG